MLSAVIINSHINFRIRFKSKRVIKYKFLGKYVSTSDRHSNFHFQIIDEFYETKQIFSLGMLNQNDDKESNLSSSYCDTVNDS